MRWTMRLTEMQKGYLTDGRWEGILSAHILTAVIGGGSVGGRFLRQVVGCRSGNPFQ